MFTKKYLIKITTTDNNTLAYNVKTDKVTLENNILKIDNYIFNMDKIIVFRINEVDQLR